MGIFEPAILGQELILLGAIGLALGLIYTYLRARAQLDLLRRIWLPALLWAIFGSLDALVTMVGTWGAPWREGNPTTRAFLYWDGWLGLVVGTFLYVLFWAGVIVGLEVLRRRLARAAGGVWASIVGGAQLLTLYALAIGHFFGFLSWTPYFPFWSQLDYLNAHAQWFFTTSPLGYDLYIGLALGSFCMALHLAIAALLRRTGAFSWVALPELQGQGEREG
ncbi:MAG TPA: hypothetical protein VF120_02335 [Ktedonobacterales bacterium]